MSQPSVPDDSLLFSSPCGVRAPPAGRTTNARRTSHVALWLAGWMDCWLVGYLYFRSSTWKISSAIITTIVVFGRLVLEVFSASSPPHRACCHLSPTLNRYLSPVAIRKRLSSPYPSPAVPPIEPASPVLFLTPFFTAAPAPGKTKPARAKFT